MEIVLFWIVLSFMVATIASKYGREGFAWWLISILFSPIVGLIALLAIGKNTDAINAKEIEDGTSKICPHCAETIKFAAHVCKHCGKEV